MSNRLPLSDPKPDAAEFIDILMGRSSASRVPLVEYIVDEAVRKPITTNLLGRAWVDSSPERETQKACFDNFIEFWYRMGYDFVRFETSLPFPSHSMLAPDTAPGSDKNRAWANEHEGAIKTWEDFEAYPWPKVSDFDFFPFEYLNEHLPEGMGLISCHAGGIFEHMSGIMSLEGICLAVCENPELVRAVSEAVGERMAAFHRHLLDLDRLIAVFQGDDMGFRTQTLIGPRELREYCLPWHKKFAAQAHEHGQPYFLHSCGNVEAIMEDLIEDVGLDGKHSFEDAIEPVESFQARYGGRIAVLGGVDINILGGGTPEDVRRRVRELIEVCGGRGRYAVGSGNSIPSYIPVENYLALLDETLACAGGSLRSR